MFGEMLYSYCKKRFAEVGIEINGSKPSEFRTFVFRKKQKF